MKKVVILFKLNKIAIRIILLIIVFFIIMSLANCASAKQQYAKNSKWLYVDNVHDTIPVWVTHVDIFGRILIRDTMYQSDSTVIGHVKKTQLIQCGF